jgi:prepilin-type N-terminal cleavage/methylation domain-containing protein
MVNGASRSAGFTLVEVIVVLVILAILAAIAIPALTGYIDKAQDRKLEMRARDIAIAVRTVVVEAYGNDEFGPSAYDPSNAALNFKGYDNAQKLFRSFFINELSRYAYDDADELERRAAALLGEEFPASTDPDSWYFAFVAALGSDTTAATADGFYMYMLPEGSGVGNPVTFVTYKMTRVDGLVTGNDFWKALQVWSAPNGVSIAYDADAGYEVYHLIEE